MQPFKRTPILILTIALIVLLASVLYAEYRITGPSTGARLEPDYQIWEHAGVVITVLTEQTGGLRSGDLVVSIAGRPVVDWARDLFRPLAPGPDWQAGQIIPVTVQRDGQLQEVDVTLTSYPLADTLRSYWGALLFALVSQVVATFVFLQRPQDRVAQLLFLWAWFACHTYIWSLGLQLESLASPTDFWLYNALVSILWLLFWSVAMHFALVFPRRHPLTYRYPGIVRLGYLAAFGILFTFLALQWVRSGNVLAWMGSINQGGYLIAVVYMTLMVGIIAWGYRESRDPEDRVKVRWVVYATFLSGGGGLILWLIPRLVIGQPLIGINVLGLLLLPFPISIAIAILRHHLFDIDLIINKTLVYGAVTATLLAIYLVSVVVLQEVFRRLTGETRSSLVTVISTLAIASLFSPLRRRIQRDIDRRFYRSKYNAERILAQFSANLREEVDLNEVSERLVSVVAETMQPTHVSLWLHPEGPGGDEQPIEDAERREQVEV